MVADRHAIAIVEPHPQQEPPPKKRKRRYQRDFIANKINYLNFQKLPLMVCLEHIETGSVHIRRAHPGLCLSHQLFCTWATPFKSQPEDLLAYHPRKIFIPDRSRLFVFAPRQSQMTARGLHFALPDTCEDGNRRRLKRHPVTAVRAVLDCEDGVMKGRLANFNAEHLLVKLEAPRSATVRPLTPGETLTLRLLDGRSTCYQGACRVIPQTTRTFREAVVLAPLDEAVTCYAPKRHRCQRYHPTLLPDVNLTHPLLKRPQTLGAEDLSGGGFAVRETLAEAVLLPGMRIRDLELRFQNGNRVGDCGGVPIHCEALVVYRKQAGQDRHGKPMVRCGLVITAITPEAHTRLLAYLTHAHNQRTYLCNPVDMDALWHFFFETGFIYPEKYAGFRERIRHIKKTYQRLYATPSNISRHFIYQENGAIRGHVAGIRAYEDSWMIHHLAADTSACPMAGLTVLKQVGHFLMAASNIASNRMKYIMNYYQAEKKFSRRLWDGVARRIDDPLKCSQHRFTYLRIRKTGVPQPPPGGYRLHPCRREDLKALGQAYRTDAGDLMLAALDLVPQRLGAKALSDEYRRMELRRSRKLFTIRSGRKLEAVCMVIRTDAGLNMSDLIHNIQVLIMPDSEMPAAALQQSLQVLADPFEEEDVAVLIYPGRYAREHFLDGSRNYTLWVLDTDASDAYFSYINRIMRFA